VSAAAEPTTVRAYFLRGEKLGVVSRTVPQTQGVAAAALRELLQGPDAGLTTAIPDGTKLLSLSVAGGVATADLSREFEAGGGSSSMQARVAQVVYTLTQFPNVRSVRFRMGGIDVKALGGEGLMLDEPKTRADYEDVTPQILVETPAPGTEVRSPLRIQGTANTFEAMFTVRLLGADGQTLAEKPVMATSGSGERGTFDESLEFSVEKATPVTLVAFEANASSGENGTPPEMHRVDVPITLVP
jgi:germination protein M